MSTSDQPPAEDESPGLDTASELEGPSETTAPSEPLEDGPKKHRRFWRRPWVLVILSLVVILVLLTGSFVGYTYYQSTRIHRIEVKHLSKPLGGTSKGTENILLVGSTDRCALKVQNPIYGICSQGVTGVNSDVVMILHLDWNTSKISILSIPRDTFIPNARSAGANKIDAALSEGPSQLVNAITQDFGIPIQHFVELNFDTFAQVVDALGGVSMYFPMPVFDAYSQLHQLSTGCVKLDGMQALAVVRARHLQYQSSPSDGSIPDYWPQESLSDLARIRRNHEFLTVLGTVVKNQGIGDPLTDARLISAIAPNLVVDSGFSTSEMLNMVLHFHNLDPNSVPQYTLPVMTSTSFTYYYQGYDYGNVTFPVNADDLVTIWQFLGVPYYTNTLTGADLPTPSQTTVSVLNGSGVYGQAQTTASQLTALGYSIGTVDDTTPVGDPAETVVAYNSLDPAVVAQAQEVFRSLTGQTIMAYQPSMSSPVTVVSGSAFAVNAPLYPVGYAPATTTTLKHGAKSTSSTLKKVAKTTTTTTTTTTAPTTTTTAPSVDGFSAANSATSTLQPWDPRSCTPNGGEGK
jgi:LCP family protein required for cell wall assembly